MIYRIPDIPYITLRFHMKAKSSALLPPVKGSMLRGAFGHALKKTVCPMDAKQSCETCLLRGQCVYANIFETYVDREPPPLFKGLKATPRPFIISAAARQTKYLTEDRLNFELTLLGRAVNKIPYVIVAFEKAAALGFTKRQHQFRLTAVDCFNEAWQPVYDGKTLSGDFSIQSILTTAVCPEKLRLRFLSPTRIVIKGKLTSDFTFRELIFKMLLRLLELAYFHVDDSAPDWHFKHFLDAADHVQLTPLRMFWRDWKRRSNKQKSLLSMGGFMGEVELKGDLAPFYPLLKAAEVVHVGKGTVFGLGKVRVCGEIV